MNSGNQQLAERILEDDSDSGSTQSLENLLPSESESESDGANATQPLGNLGDLLLSESESESDEATATQPLGTFGDLLPSESVEEDAFLDSSSAAADRKMRPGRISSTAGDKGTGSGNIPPARPSAARPSAARRAFTRKSVGDEPEVLPRQLAPVLAQPPAAQVSSSAARPSAARRRTRGAVTRKSVGDEPEVLPQQLVPVPTQPPAQIRRTFTRKSVGDAPEVLPQQTVLPQGLVSPSVTAAARVPLPQSLWSPWGLAAGTPPPSPATPPATPPPPVTPPPPATPPPATPNPLDRLLLPVHRSPASPLSDMIDSHLDELGDSLLSPDPRTPPARRLEISPNFEADAGR